MSAVTYPMRTLQEAGAPFPFGEMGAKIKRQMERLATLDMAWLLTALRGVLVTLPYRVFETGYLMGREHSERSAIIRAPLKQV